MMSRLRTLGSGSTRLVLMTLLALASCGGDTGGVGVGGTGQVATTVSVSGPITGFGSVIVQGLKFDDTVASVQRDAQAISSGNLRLGMTIVVKGTRNADGVTGTASSITVYSELQGPVQSVQVSSGTLSVLGVPVTVDASTVFDGATDLSSIQVGSLVEVYGLRNASTGAVAATRIEVTPAPVVGPPPVLLKGSISNLNTTAHTFVVDQQTVQYGSATLSGTLAAGVSVKVTGTLTAAGGNTVTASSVVVVSTPSVTSGQTLEFSGIVSNFVSPAQFMINGLSIDASSSKLPSAQVALLQNGARCEIDGQVQNGVVVVSEMSCQGSTPSATVYDVTGTITAFVSASNFTVRNQVINASQASFSGGRLSDLGLGKTVHAQGPVVGGIVQATTVSFSN